MLWCSSLLVLAVCCDGATLRTVSQMRKMRIVSSESTGDWAALHEAESEDRSFLLAQLDQTENELVKLQSFLESSGKASALVGLQISASPVKTADVAANSASKAPEAKKEAAKVAPAATKATMAAPTVAKPEMDPAKLMKLKGQMALAPMLAMLKGLYQDSKDRIAQQNAREEKSKKWFTGKEAEHKAKMDKIEGNFKNGSLSEEFRTNETRDETRYFTYWSRCRERQHRQFHTNLKIQHAMMMKTKKMIEMYEKTLSGKASDHEEAKKQLQGAGGMPEIVFLQEFHRTVGRFCQDSLAEVRKEQAELKQPMIYASEDLE